MRRHVTRRFKNRHSEQGRRTFERLDDRRMLDGSAIISEFLAVNDDGLRDARDEATDWIEIFNPGETAVDLAGWRLTDDADDTEKWTFPTARLESGEFLTVFASTCVVVGSECPAADTELHTNFSLAADGEYLALIAPDGSIASEFGGATTPYPKQFEDVSYGIQQAAASLTLVDSRSSAEFSIVDEDIVDTSWTHVDFATSPADWHAGSASVGYAVEKIQPLRIDFNARRTRDIDDTQNGFHAFNLDQNGESFDGVQITFAPFGGATLDERDRSTPIDNEPRFTQGQLYDDFIFANGTTDGKGLEVLLEGLLPNHLYEVTLWSYDASSASSRISDWKETLRDQRMETNYAFDGSDLPTSNNEYTITTNLVSSEDGRLNLRGVRNGGSSHGVYLNGLQLRSADLRSEVSTDVEERMFDVSASALLRVPFEIPSSMDISSAQLELNYDDGFVAYINGVEIARENAPGVIGEPVSTTARATVPQEHEQAAATFVLDLADQIGLLRPGQSNVLAIHGLNVAPADADFLVAPRLTITEGINNDLRYFAAPTPGLTNGSGFVDIVSDTRFSVDRGFYDEAFELTISSDTPGSTVIYTTDGSVPSTFNGTRVASTDATSSPVALLTIDSTTYVRAIAIKDRYLSTNVDTQTYLFLDDVIRQDPLSDPNAPTYPTIWQAGATADFEMDPEVVAQWDDNNPGNVDFGIRESLTSIPTMSIVMNHDDLWGGRGIYKNSESRGEAFRRPASVEYFDANGSREFQVNAGVQVHGGASRDNVRLKKHSFRLLFRDDFDGPDQLNFPLFSDSELEEFNTLVLRAFFTDAFATRTSTNRYSPMDSLYLRDVWMKDTQLAMGQLSGHNTYVHLYINGLYWGLYNPSERPDDAFLAGHLGGDRDDWDIVKDFNEQFRGEKTAWNEMFAIANDLPSAANPDVLYQQLQGNNADGSPNPTLPNYLDADNLIDYMILHQYGGAEDWPHHNWYAGRNRVDPGRGFKFFVWDQEIVLDGRFRDLTETGQAGDHRFTPAGLYDKLRHSPQFRLDFADRVQQHFAPGGALSNEVSQANWMQRANEIEKAIIAESARWGDAREGELIQIDSGAERVVVPTITVDIWRAERDIVHNDYFPEIRTRYLQHYAEDDLLPPLAAPAFDQAGGTVPAGHTVNLSTDVTRPFFKQQVILPESSLATAFVPTDGQLDGTPDAPIPPWTRPDYDDSHWIQGTGGIGFDERPGYEVFWGIDLLSPDLPEGQGMDPDGDGNANMSTFYSRFEFEIDQIGPEEVDQLLLNVRYDDGFVAYLNGVEIARTDRLPPIPTWDSLSGRSHQANGLDEFDVSEFKDLLRLDGTNVLAFHVLNRTLGSDDLLISPELVLGTAPEGLPVVYYTLDGSDPRMASGQPSPQAHLFDGPISIEATMEVRARGWLGDRWSAEESETFVVNSEGLNGLRVTEINYNPPPPTTAERIQMPRIDNDAFEFVELFNASNAPISLLGSQFTDGIEFTFAENIILASGELGVVVADASAFQMRYGDAMRIVGEYTNRLANRGERLEFADSNGNHVLEVSYDDAGLWPESADGIGATLELVAADHTPQQQLSKPHRWRGSTEFGGTPGRLGQGPIGIVINEVLANTPADENYDAIELWNTTDRDVEIGGWYLSDSATDPFKYQLASNITLSPGDFWVVDETAFGDAFGLSGTRGDDVWLVAKAADGRVGSFVDAVHFPPSAPNESFGRMADGLMAPVTSSTLGHANSPARVGPLVIGEVQYHPSEPSAAAREIMPGVNADDLEFIEIHNPTSTSFDLDGWQIDGGIEYAFVGSTPVAAGESLVVVSFRPESVDNELRLQAFRTHYDLNETTRIEGGYQGRLSNSGELIRLMRPITETGNTFHIIEDQVIFDDLTPWPTRADGQGNSLQRIDLSRYGSLASAWLGAPPTPGAFDEVHADFNRDGDVNVDDLDLMCGGIRNANLEYDVNRDGSVDRHDPAWVVDSLLQTSLGDVNLDGRFDAEDLVALLQSGEYHDSTDGNSSWSSGDRNCDGELTSEDIVLMFRFGGYQG